MYIVDMNTYLFSNVISSCWFLRDDHISELGIRLRLRNVEFWPVFTHEVCFSPPKLLKVFWELFPRRQTFTSGKRPCLKLFIYRRVKLSSKPSPRLSSFVSVLRSLRVYKTSCVFHLVVKVKSVLYWGTDRIQNNPFIMKFYKGAQTESHVHRSS